MAIHRFDSVSSTNDVALRLARGGAPAGECVVADAQSAGRGRGGHSWSSPPGKGLLFSVVLRPNWPPETLPLATIACGIAVATGIRDETGLETGLKWPNDILVGGCKCAGILCEAETDTSGGAFVVAGVGINVNTPPEALPPRPIFPATSLAAQAGAEFDRERILMACLSRITAEISSDEPPGRLADRFNGMDALRGRRLAAALPDGTVLTGLNLGIDGTGSLRLETPTGVATVIAASISAV